MRKSKVNSILKMTWLLAAYFTRCQVIPDYYYPGDFQTKTFSYTGTPDQKSLFVGFWITPEMKAGVACPFLSISQSGFAQPETFDMRTETSSTYAMHANNDRCFAFNGTANNESFLDEYVVRRTGASWSYF